MAIDPKDILFSLPTLCESTPAVDPLPRPDTCRSLHEDDWRQIEFVPHTNRAHIEKELHSLAAFRKQYRRDQGWSKVYIRHGHPVPLAARQLRFEEMPALSLSPLHIGSGPPWGGLVKGGFALSDSSNWFIYGQRTSDGKVLQLGLSPNASAPSKILVEGLSQIAENLRLLLIDWYTASIVDSISAESIVNWAMRYQKA